MNLEVSPPEQVLWIWRTLEEAGFETWIVGGAIRDTLFGRPVGDWDFATAAHPKQIMTAFRRTVPIGVDHGTVGVLAADGTLYEVTTFRRDVETFGRRAVVEFAKSIEEDLGRRDFTLNALAWHPGREEMLDPWDGATDLNERILRTVGNPTERFAEDLLRVLRALRFAGQFGLTIEGETWRALLSAVPELSQLSSERVQEEMMKVLSQARKPSVALGLYAESGVFAALYPELDIGLLEDVAEGLAPTLRACDAVPHVRPWVRLSLLMALISATGDKGVLDEPTHEATDPEPSIRDTKRSVIEDLMERLRFSNADTKHVARVAAELSPAPLFEEPAVLRRWLNRVGPEHFADIARAWLARARGCEKPGRDSAESETHGRETSETEKLETVKLERTDAAPRDVVDRINALRKILREDPPLTIADLALDGSDLKRMGLPPGPQFGEILRYLLEEVLDRPEVNNRADLEDLAAQGGFLIDASSDS